MYQRIAVVLPKRLMARYAELLRYSDIRVPPERFVGFLLLFGAGVSFALAFNAAVLLSFPSEMLPAVFLATYVSFHAIVYLLLSIAAEREGKQVDIMLPDALQLMAMNIKSGMTTDRALLLAARPEFGPLEKELNRAGKDVLVGKDIRSALLQMPKRVKSKQLERTAALIAEGIESGGDLSDLLQQTADDIRNARLMQAEVRANVMMYAIFIFFAAGVGAPLLYAISTHLVGVLSGQFAQFRVDETLVTGVTMLQGQINLSADFLTGFALAAMAITSIFGSMVIGIVQNGREKDGLKYIPVLLAVSLAVFYAVRLLVTGVLPGL